jgi:hypothetical protein
MKEGEKETLEEIDELVRIKREIYFTICVNIHVSFKLKERVKN